MAKTILPSLNLVLLSFSIITLIEQSRKKHLEEKIVTFCFALFISYVLYGVCLESMVGVAVSGSVCLHTIPVPL